MGGIARREVPLADLTHLADTEFDRYFEGGSPGGSRRDDLIQHFLPLVRAIARKISSRLPPSVDYDDLVSAGTLGLLYALDRYTPQEGGDFRRYAGIRIRGTILDDLRSLDWAPRSRRQEQAAMDEARHEVVGQKGRKATPEEIAAAMEMSLEDYQRMRSRISSKLLVHLEDMGTLRGEGRSAFEILEDPSAADPAALTALRNTYEQLTAAVDSLTDRERIIITLYYFDHFMAKDISKILGVTEGRVSQIHHGALARLKKKLFLKGVTPDD
jgi:RNA polymerase sigma factor FliA